MALKLEVFETDTSGRDGTTIVLDTIHLEETKLASYDAGYAAGWEDAATAQSGDQTRIAAELANNLQGYTKVKMNWLDQVIRQFFVWVATDHVFQKQLGLF